MSLGASGRSQHFMNFGRGKLNPQIFQDMLIIGGEAVLSNLGGGKLNRQIFQDMLIIVGDTRLKESRATSSRSKAL